MRQLTKREGILAGIFACLLGLFFFMRGCDKKIDRQTVSNVLNPGTIKKVVVNPDKNQIDVITANKTETLFLPDRPSSIEIGPHGETTITAKQFGTELHPFIGGQVSDSFRIAAGLDLLYYKKIDLGLGFGGQIGAHTPIVFVQVAYTVYSNLRLGFTVDNRSHLGASLSLRL